MKKQTELVFVLDRSGSMEGLEKDTIGGFNSTLEKQKKEQGEAFVTTVLFDHKYELLYQSEDIQDVQPLTEKEYYVRGMTALLDAIGMTISKISERQKSLESKRDVLFVIMTDGMENSSKEYNIQQIKQSIEQKRAEKEWQFLFLGANIDAIAEANKFGIAEDFAVNFHADHVGMEKNFETIHEVATHFRSGVRLDASWKEHIEKDFQER